MAMAIQEQRLTILRTDGLHENGAVMVIAQCVCGKRIRTRRYSILSGNCRSCGCLRKESRDVIGFHNQLFSRYRHAAKKRGYNFGLTKEEFYLLVSSACTYCGAPPAKTTLGGRREILANGVDRLDSSVGYIVSNCVSCCKTCNIMKNVHSPETFLDHCRAVVRYTDGLGVWNVREV